MRNHNIQIIEVHGGGHQAVCTCRARSTVVPLAWQADDWRTAHLEMVERVKSYLRTKTPTLKDQRDYFQEMADDPDNPQGERLLWKALAAEITARLRDTRPPNEGQEPLW